jgi:hypothetical protein
MTVNKPSNVISSNEESGVDLNTPTDVHYPSGKEVVGIVSGPSDKASRHSVTYVGKT